MTPMMVETAAFVVFALSTWYFLYKVVPTLGKRATLCLLHNRRDQIYKLRENREAGEDSLILEDMLFSLTVLIHVIREKPQRMVLRFVASILKGSERTEDDDSDWRSRRYKYEANELFSGTSGTSDLRNSLKIYREKNLVLTLYLVTSHPILFVLSLLVSISLVPLLYLLWLWNSWKKAGVSSVEDTLDSIRTYQDRHSSEHSYA